MQAVRLGIPSSYTTAIINIGFNIPWTYPKWKVCILIMYEECQKKWVHDQINGARDQHDSKPSRHQKALTATSHNQKTGGASSSSTAKLAAQGQGHNAGTGQWTTYKGQGKLMDMDWQKHMSEGRCFICHKEGAYIKGLPTEEEEGGGMCNGNGQRATH